MPRVLQQETPLAGPRATTCKMEKEIKAKSEELDDLKEKLVRERDEKEKLQKQLQSVSTSQSESSRKLAKANEITEKLRAENQQKKEHIEKLERNISHMEDRIRNLEIRASEVEKAELTLESTRRTLETKMSELRDKDKQLDRAYEKHEEVQKELEAAKMKISELEKKLEDLKLQVRYELMKNENIERGLETIPRLKDDISERDAKIASLEKELEERAALLNSSRKVAREYKERIRTLERNEDEVYSLREELDFARNEVNTLKRLMTSKDSIVLNKCHTLDQAKATVDTLKLETKHESERAGLRRIQNVLEQLKQLYVTSLGEEHKGQGGVSWAKDRPVPHNRYVQSRPRSAVTDRGIDVNNHPYGNGTNNNNTENSDHNHLENTNGSAFNGHSSTYIFLERFLQDTESPDSKKGRQQQQQQQPQQNRWASTPRAGTAKSVGAVGGRAGQSNAGIQRSASFHHLDQVHANNNNNNNSYNNSTVPLKSRPRKGSPFSHTTSAGLGSPRLSSRSPQTSASYHGRQQQQQQHRPGSVTAGGSRGSTGNMYTSEHNHRHQRYQPSLDYALGVSTDEELTTDNCLSNNNNYNNKQVRPRSSGSPSARRDNSQPQSNTGSDTETTSLVQSQYESEDPFGPRLSSRQAAVLSGMSAQHKDAILCDVIQIGDRASITVSQKPPRYGRKKPKPITYTGIVKYKGNLDKEHFDARIYVGLRLDAPLGESDGTYKGKRYMFTPPSHARFFKIRDLDSVLDVPTGMYITTSKLILRHQEIHLRYQQEQQYQQQQQQLNGDSVAYDYDVSTDRPDTGDAIITTNNSIVNGNNNVNKTIVVS